MNYILDILGCATISIMQLSKVLLVGILIQATVYRMTGFSIFNAIKNFVMSEVD